MSVLIYSWSSEEFRSFQNFNTQTSWIFCLSGMRQRAVWWRFTRVSQQLAASILWPTEATCFDESWITFYHVVWRYISEDSKLYSHRHRDVGRPRKRQGNFLWIRKEKRTTLINARVYLWKLWLYVWKKVSCKTTDEHGTEVATVFRCVYPRYSLDMRRRGPQNLLHIATQREREKEIFYQNLSFSIYLANLLNNSQVI